MKTTPLLILSLLLAPVSWADEETRKLDEFTKIRLKANANVEVVQGNTHEIQINTDSDTLERLETTVSGDRLTISLEDRWFSWLGDRDITLLITFEDLDEIEILGSGDIEGEDLALEDLNVHIRGSGDVDLDRVSAERLEVSIHGAGDVDLTGVDAANVVTIIRGSGDIDLSGHANTVESTIQGSGNLDADDLSAEQVSVVITGSGDASVNAETSLDAVIRGSGNIRYAGDPEVTEKVYGSGNIVEM